MSADATCCLCYAYIYGPFDELPSGHARCRDRSDCTDRRALIDGNPDTLAGEDLERWKRHQAHLLVRRIFGPAQPFDAHS